MPGLGSINRSRVRKFQVYKVFTEVDGGLQSGSKEPVKSEGPMANRQRHSFHKSKQTWAGNGCPPIRIGELHLFVIEEPCLKFMHGERGRGHPGIPAVLLEWTRHMELLVSSRWKNKAARLASRTNSIRK